MSGHLPSRRPRLPAPILSAILWALLGAVPVAPLTAGAQVVPPNPPPSYPPHVGGQWGPVLVWPHVPVSMASLPDGRILTFASNEPNSFPGSTTDEYTHAAVWDPETGAIQNVPHPNHDMFCAALVTLESGEPFVMGGRNQGDSPWTSYFDFHNDRWVQIENMNRGRWYPTAVYLGNGEVFIAAGVGGGVNPERWSPETGWKLLTGIDLSSTILQFGTRDGSGSWPMLQLAQDGTVFHHGATDRMTRFDPFGGPGGLGTLTDLGPHNFGWFADEGVSVLYDEGKILVAGGSVSVTDDTAVAGAHTIDINGPGPVVTRVADMNFPRQFQNEVLLPTGDVLVVGGNTSGVKFTDDFAVRSAEVWNPATNTWKLLNAQNQARAYHSTAVLLSDATVLSAGGGLGGNSCANPQGPGECENDHWNAERYSPPYLFASDGSPAVRPGIQDAPGIVRVGRTFTVRATPGLSGFSMVRLSATTHTMNTDQRFLRPGVVETAPGTYELTLHANRNVLVPGYWMLFAMSGQVPSVAHTIQVVKDGTPRGEPIASLRHEVGQDVLEQIEAEDPDGNPLLFGAVGLPPGLSIDGETGVISGVATQAGIYDVTVTASDGVEAGIVSFPWIVATARSEIGTVVVSQANENQWHTVELDAAYQDPIVVLGPPGYADTAPTTVRVRNVTPTSFQFKIDEWLYLDGAHGAEVVSYLVVEAGEYLLPGGGSLVAGRTVGVDYENPRTQPFAASVFGETPLVLAQVATANGSRAVTPRLEGVSASGFTVRIQGEEALGTNVAFEDVHFIALERVAVAGLLSAGITPNSVDEIPEPVSYGQVFSGAPHLLAHAQTRNGGDPAALRHLSPTPAGVSFLIEEERSGDAEVAHADEVVGWLAVAPTASSLALLPLFNEAPTVVAPPDPVGVRGVSVSLFVQASDPEGDALTFSASGLPAGLSIHPETGQILGTPIASGVHAVTVTVTDTSAASDAAGFLWTVQDPLELLPFATPPDLVTNAIEYTAQTSFSGDFLFTWNFGDGTPPVGPADAASVSHTFSAPGRYIVTLSVTDPVTGDTDERQFVQNVTAPPTALRPTSSTSITYEEAADRVWVVNPDHDSVTVLDAVTRTRLAEIPVCDDPRSVAVAGDGRVWVACKDDATLAVVDPAGFSVASAFPLPRGSRPHGLVFDPTGAVAFVALEAAGRVLKLDGVTGAELAARDVGLHVRHLAVSADGSTLWATRFVTPPLPGEDAGAPETESGGALVGGELLRFGTGSLAPGTTVILGASLQPDSEQSARGIPNYLGAPAISPQGTELLVPSKQDNVLRGVLRDGIPLGHDSTVRAVSSRVDLSTGLEDRIARLDHDNASVASATIYDANGAYAFTALEGNRQISVLDPFTHFELGRVVTGRAPHGLALSPDGRTLYVDDFMDRSVSIFDLSPLLDFDDPALPQLARVGTVAAEALPPDVLLGKQHFYDALDPRLALESYMACAACHNDGEQDGRTWDFTQFGEGLRNTITLQGHGLNQGRLHWSANFDEVQDFEGQIRGFTLGTGLMEPADFAETSAPLGPPKAGRSADLDALAAYVTSLSEVGSSPHRAADGSLTENAVHGRGVFATQGCGGCHRGAGFTDSPLDVMHDVGTLAPSSGPQVALDTPSLRGLWNTGPHLHDGSAVTLEDAVAAHAGVDLPAAEMAQLVSYLEQIDDAETSAPNSTPAVTTPAPQTTREGAGALLPITASDPDGDALTLSVAGLPSGLTFDPATRAITGTVTAGAGAASPYQVTISASDGEDSTPVDFTWTILPDECHDGADNDGDGMADAADPGCGGGSLREAPECSDDVDNDGDGRVDFDGAGGAADPDCGGQPWRSEHPVAPACGLGFEVALLLPVWTALRRRRSRRT